MNQNTLNMGINFNQISINDSSIQETNNQNQDYNVWSYPNFKSFNSLNPYDYKIEEDSFLNNYYYSPNNLLIDKEFNKEKLNEKTTKVITNEERAFQFEIREGNISFPELNKESNEEIIKNEYKKDLNIKNYLGGKRKNNNCKGEHNKYSDDNIRRKAKNLVLDYTMDFLNERIKNIYNGNKIGRAHV